MAIPSRNTPQSLILTPIPPGGICAHLRTAVLVPTASNRISRCDHLPGKLQMIKSVIKRNVIRLLVKARQNKKIRALSLAR
nr:MAG TPA: hypothetical protein [Caudoviricetes sp.]